MREKDSAAHSDQTVYEAVKEVADDLDLELESMFEEGRMVGAFAAPVAHSSSDTETDAETESASASDSSSDDDSEALAGSDDDQIKAALDGFANTHPEDMVDRHGHHTTDSYAAVTPDGVHMVDKSFLQKWLSSSTFQSLMDVFTPHRERKTTVSNVQIVYLNQWVASATFQEREEGQDGKVAVGNAAAMLIKSKSGDDAGTWKIAAVSKYGELE